MRRHVALVVLACGLASAAPRKPVVAEFGCSAWSEAKQLVACVVGSRGWNIGGQSIAVAFAPIRGDAAVPETVMLAERGEEQGRLSPELSSDASDKLAASLAGFTALDRRGARIETKRTGDRLAIGPPIKVGATTIRATLAPIDPLSVAPAANLVLTVRVAGVDTVLHDQREAFSSISIHAFALGTSVIVEEAYSVGDEGISGTFGQAWRCTATCEPIQ